MTRERDEGALARLKQLTRFYTPLISDAADALHVRVGVIDSSSGISPAFGVATPIAGWAYPCQNRQTSERIEIDVLLEMVDSLAPGDFVIVAEQVLSGAALWGGLMSRAASRRGAVGALCNGPARDWAQIQDLEFPVFSVGWTVKDIRGRSEMIAYGVPVEVAGTPVNPGDIVVADSNGVIVIPDEPGVLKGVIEWCDEKLQAEERTDKELAAGVGALDSYRRFGRF